MLNVSHILVTKAYNGDVLFFKTNVLGEPVSEAVCIVADTDKW